jgi:hypothetical protein
METEPSPSEKKGRKEENKNTSAMKFVQINLHHSKAATAVLC